MARTIKTSHQFPPIPIRSFDWLAYFEGDEEGPQGWGPTEAEAIADLTENYDAPEDKADLTASDCKTPADWARWVRERREYEDPMGYERTRY